jgi:DNA-binding NarL/FixJ family response regulator
MKVVIFSSDTNIINEWVQKYSLDGFLECYDLESFESTTSKENSFLFICDYDSVASDLNTLISSKKLPPYTVVLEKSPAIATGKMLIKNGVKAYGNSRMLAKHFSQLRDVVSSGDVWTYPELTSALVKATKKASLNKDANSLIDSRLTQKEKDVVYLILDGLTNEAIANELDITVRTVKAHISSIFSKLHVNDRISLVLLLK